MTALQSQNSGRREEEEKIEECRKSKKKKKKQHPKNGRTVSYKIFREKIATKQNSGWI